VTIGQWTCEKRLIGDWRPQWSPANLATVDDTRHLEVRLPPDLSNKTYAALTHAVWAVLNAAGLGDTSYIRPDSKVTDAELISAFDRDTLTYPWGP
jgi:hypothetical protein